MANKTPNQIIEDLSPHFEKMKEVIDKYPKAFSLKWESSEGYILSIDFDLLTHPSEVVD